MDCFYEIKGERGDSIYFLILNLKKYRIKHRKQYLWIHFIWMELDPQSGS